MSDRPTCDTPGCGRPIPKGGEGHPEICPTCLEQLAHDDKVKWEAVKEYRTRLLQIADKAAITPGAFQFSMSVTLADIGTLAPDRIKAFFHAYPVHALSRISPG